MWLATIIFTVDVGMTKVNPAAILRGVVQEVYTLSGEFGGPSSISLHDSLMLAIQAPDCSKKQQPCTSRRNGAYCALVTRRFDGEVVFVPYPENPSQ